MTCPARSDALAKIQLSPIMQSCATCAVAMIRQFLPITVSLLAIVPLFTVTNSRIIVLSPIIAKVSSPRYFKSCGMAEITALGKICTFFPIRAPLIMHALEPIHVLSPISTFSWITTNGSIVTFLPIFAFGCICDSLLIIV